jgi:hypothetical protein
MGKLESFERELEVEDSAAKHGDNIYCKHEVVMGYCTIFEKESYILKHSKIKYVQWSNDNLRYFYRKEVR